MLRKKCSSMTEEFQKLLQLQGLQNDVFEEEEKVGDPRPQKTQTI